MRKNGLQKGWTVINISETKKTWSRPILEIGKELFFAHGLNSVGSAILNTTFYIYSEISFEWILSRGLDGG